MADTLKMLLVQKNLVWEDILANLNGYTAMIADRKTDVVVLPEMFSTGFTMNPTAFAKDNETHALPWMQQLAKKSEALVVGSLILEEKESFFNRLVVAFPNGDFLTYDKRHLFGLGGEPGRYAPGSDRLVFDYKGWKICPLVCYDLRFPVWSRNTVDYDLLIYVANWPAVRNFAWKSLLTARAIENMTYTVGVNRVGEDGHGMAHIGHSVALDFLGNNLVKPLVNREGVLEIEVKKSTQDSVRQKLGFLEDRDAFILV